jgi:hypothetical protein
MDAAPPRLEWGDRLVWSGLGLLVGVFLIASTWASVGQYRIIFVTPAVGGPLSIVLGVHTLIFGDSSLQHQPRLGISTVLGLLCGYGYYLLLHHGP